MKVGPKVMGAQAFKKLTQGARPGGEHGRTFAISKQHGAVLVFHVHRPNRLNWIEPRRFIQPKAARGKFCLHGGDGGLE